MLSLLIEIAHLRSTSEVLKTALKAACDIIEVILIVCPGGGSSAVTYRKYDFFSY